MLNNLNMECAQISEYLIDYIDLKLDEQICKEVDIHLEKCESCSKEFSELKDLFKAIDTTENHVPGKELKESFAKALDIEKNKNILSTKLMYQSIFVKYKLVWQIAAAIMLLFTGYLSGYNMKTRQLLNNNQTQQLNEMQNDVSEMKRMMALNLLKDESASQRIKAVNYTEELSSPDHTVINALIETLNNDKNTNVRLAAVYSLARFKTDKKVKEAFILTLNKQEDPMIQIVIINILVEIEDVKAIDELKKLLKNKDLNNDVKTQAELGVKVLS
jgi:hypothetical protein